MTPLHTEILRVARLHPIATSKIRQIALDHGQSPGMVNRILAGEEVTGERETLHWIASQYERAGIDVRGYGVDFGGSLGDFITETRDDVLDSLEETAEEAGDTARTGIVAGSVLAGLGGLTYAVGAGIGSYFAYDLIKDSGILKSVGSGIETLLSPGEWF